MRSYCGHSIATNMPGIIEDSSNVSLTAGVFSRRPQNIGVPSVMLWAFSSTLFHLLLAIEQSAYLTTRSHYAWRQPCEGDVLLYTPRGLSRTNSHHAKPKQKRWKIQNVGMMNTRPPTPGIYTCACTPRVYLLMRTPSGTIRARNSPTSLPVCASCGPRQRGGYAATAVFGAPSTARAPVSALWSLSIRWRRIFQQAAASHMWLY